MVPMLPIDHQFGWEKVSKEQYSHTLSTQSHTPAQLLIGFFSYYGTARVSPPSLYSANGSHILLSGPSPSAGAGASSSTQGCVLGGLEVGLGVLGSFDPFVQCVSMKGLSQPIKYCARSLIQEIIGEWDEEVKQLPLPLPPHQQSAYEGDRDDLQPSSSSSVPLSTVVPSSSAVNTIPIPIKNSISTDSINANTSADDLRLKLKQLLAAAAAPTPSRLAGSGEKLSSSSMMMMMTTNSAVADAAQVPRIVNYLKSQPIPYQSIPDPTSYNTPYLFLHR